MEQQKNAWRVMLLMIAAGAMISLAGCGGGGGGGTAGANGTISGSVIKGPVDGAAVAAYGISSNGTVGPQLATAMTDSAGNFSLTVGSYAGSVMMQVSGGSYMDEATGVPMTLYSGDVMTSVIPVMISGETMTGIQVTPLTSMAQRMAQNMAGQMTSANITSANTAVSHYFSISDILHIRPMDPTVSGSGIGATADEKNYGMTVAAMSQEAKALSMPSSSGMVTAFMDDASDGVMNGMMGSTSIVMNGMGGGGMMGSMSSTAGTTGLASAMATFMTNTAVNRSEITTSDVDISALMNKLNSAPTQTIQ